MDDPSSGQAKPDKREQRIELRRQADLIIQDFKRLRKNVHSWPTAVETEVSIERLRPEKELLTRLDSSLLPQLRQQCADLSGLLRKACYLKKDPASTFKLISDIQTNLHLTLGQTIQTLNEIFPGRVPEPYQTNDQHFNEFKIYRLYCFETSIRINLKFRLEYLFQQSIYIIKYFKLSKKRHRCYMRFASSTTDEAIDSAIGFSKKSELSLIWNIWDNALDHYDEQLDLLLSRTDPMRILHGEDDNLWSEAAIELGTSLIPVFKLSRLFFKKLYRQRIKQEVKLFTEMCSDQLYLLDRSTDDIRESLCSMLYSIDDADRLDPLETRLAIMQALKQLATSFKSYLCLISGHIIPNLFPVDIDFTSYVYFQNWYMTWTTSFLLATDNSIRIVQSFGEI